MELVYIGKIVSTHGIKGELRIISDFQYINKVFVIGNSLIIDNKTYLIKSYRHHKIYEMVTLNDYKNINEVEFLIGKKVYIDKDMLNLDENEVLDSDLLKFNAIIDNKSFSIRDVFTSGGTNKLIRINYKDKEILVPLNSPMIKKIDKMRKEIYIELIEGMK